MEEKKNSRIGPKKQEGEVLQKKKHERERDPTVSMHVGRAVYFACGPRVQIAKK